MMIQMNYSTARANLASLLDRVTENRDVVIIRRRRAEHVAIVAAAELSGLRETVHLLRSSANTQRLLAALDRALAQPRQPRRVTRKRRRICRRLS
jgi:antitoxin YefM